MCAAPKGNQYAKDCETSGQPLKFKSVNELQTKIEAYFNSCYKTCIDDTGLEYKENIRPLTMSGLAVALDTTRQTLINYANKEEYFATIKNARSIVEAYAEENLFSARNPAGTIFSLKNNYSWIDKQEIVQDINANINQIVVAPVKFDEE